MRIELKYVNFKDTSTQTNLRLYKGYKNIYTSQTSAIIASYEC